MNNPMIEEIKDKIFNQMNHKKKDYLSLSEVRHCVPSKLFKASGIKRKSSNQSIIEGFALDKIEGLMLCKKGKTTYVCRTDAKTMIMNQFNRVGKWSLGLLHKTLGPIKKSDYIQFINQLISDEILSCAFSIDGKTIYLFKSYKSRQKEDERPIDIEQAANEFYEAYKQIGKGKSFVRVHRIRDTLNWSHKKFDHVIENLMKTYMIELHGGDPSMLTDTEIKKSYSDSNGFLYITVTWWGNK